MTTASPLRICVLGNCHAASIKIGWQRLENRYPDINLTFFADRKKRLEGLEVRADCLYPASEELKASISHTSGGIDNINPKNFDIFLLIGLSFKFPSGFFRLSSRQHLSAAVEDLAWSAYLQQQKRSPAFALLTKIRSVSNKPIFLGHNPLAARRPKEDSDWTAMDKQEIAKNYNEFLLKMKSKIVSDPGVSLLAQPIETIEAGFYTGNRFSIQSTRLEIGSKTDGRTHSEQDTYHMNGEYGEIYLNRFIESHLSPWRRSNIDTSSSTDDRLDLVLLRSGGAERGLISP